MFRGFVVLSLVLVVLIVLLARNSRVQGPAEVVALSDYAAESSTHALEDKALDNAPAVQKEESQNLNQSRGAARIEALIEGKRIEVSKAESLAPQSESSKGEEVENKAAESSEEESLFAKLSKSISDAISSDPEKKKEPELKPEEKSSEVSRAELIKKHEASVANLKKEADKARTLALKAADAAKKAAEEALLAAQALEEISKNGIDLNLSEGRVAAKKAVQKITGNPDHPVDPETKLPSTAGYSHKTKEGGKVYFSFNSCHLTDSGTALLKRIVKATEKADKINVMGFSDSKGPEALNKDISACRAQKVASFLTDNGVAKEKIVRLSYGTENPSASNDTPLGRMENRRVEIRLQ